MPLTDTAVRTAKPGAKPLRLFDSGGLYLEVAPSGGKWWRFKYRFAGKEKRISLGVYPDVSLKDARERRDAARKQLANDVDPSENRKAIRAVARSTDEESFEVIAREWLNRFQSGWTPKHSERVLRWFERDVFPAVGPRHVREINAPEVLAVLRRVECRGVNEVPRRILQCCSKVFRYAVATGRAERDPCSDLRGALSPVNARHFATMIKPKAIGALLRAIDEYQGEFSTQSALKLAPLTFVRPGELRHAEWAEFDLDAAEWRIPAAKMKMRVQHIVPLSRQAIDVINGLRPATGDGRYLFPSLRSKTRPMSNNTVLGALRRLGYSKDEMTGHGFRSMASTLLNEQGWNRDAIERQLAHAERDAVRAAYNYAEYLPERRRMMQSWADYLDGLRNGAKVLRLRDVG